MCRPKGFHKGRLGEKKTKGSEAPTSLDEENNEEKQISGTRGETDSGTQ